MFSTYATSSYVAVSEWKRPLSPNKPNTKVFLTCYPVNTCISSNRLSSDRVSLLNRCGWPNAGLAASSLKATAWCK